MRSNFQATITFKIVDQFSNFAFKNQTFLTNLIVLDIQYIYFIENAEYVDFWPMRNESDLNDMKSDIFLCHSVYKHRICAFVWQSPIHLLSLGWNSKWIGSRYESTYLFCILIFQMRIEPANNFHNFSPDVLTLDIQCSLTTLQCLINGGVQIVGEVGKILKI